MQINSVIEDCFTMHLLFVYMVFILQNNFVTLVILFYLHIWLPIVNMHPHNSLFYKNVCLAQPDYLISNDCTVG